MKVRTRMAPSPTGEYHIGHIRTVLYNYAFAKKYGGSFIVRIEDTDRNRFVSGATDKILNVISDFDLSWDEGPRVGGDYGPYIQSERLDIYKEHAKDLIKRGAAYYCFCTPERLSKLREKQKEEGFSVTKYDKKCLKLSKKEIQERLARGEPYVIRLNVPRNKDIGFVDKVYGEINVNTNDVDDQILLKSDGYPSYHLAVVVDDHLMDITHVMRGNDWIPSTPKHIMLYEAFGWEVPTYIHLPNLKEKAEDKKLSKRFGSVYAVQFLEEGYLPEALINFLMFLGWNPGTQKEIYTLDEFIADFSLDRIHKTDLVSFDREKLVWINGRYIREMEPKNLYNRIINWKNKFDIRLPEEFLDEKNGLRVLSLVQKRLKRFGELNSLINYFYENPVVDKNLLFSYTDNDFKKTKKILNEFIKEFKNMSDSNWNGENIHDRCQDVLKNNNFSPKEGFMSLRVAVSGVKATPPIEDTLGAIGYSSVIRRLEDVVNVIDS